MLAHAILDEDRRTSSHALKSDFDKNGNMTKKGCADLYLNTEGSQFKEDLGLALTHFDPMWRRYSKVPLDILYPYACADADLTLSLVFPFMEMMREEGLLHVFQEIVMPLQHAIMLLELHGAPLNIPKARQVEAEQRKIMEDLTPKIHELAGGSFNIASPEKLGQILFVDMGLEGGKKTKHGKWVVDADTLGKIDHPIGEPVLKYRKAQKIQSTYATSSLQLVREITDNGEIGWVHPTYWLDSATGRLRCQDPNLTNLPRPENGGDIVKGMWACPPGYRILFKDFSQIELRVIEFGNWIVR
jgi:DNA polymerase-1